MKVILHYLNLPVASNQVYFVKFSTDGAKLTNNFCGVQGTIRILDVDDDERVFLPSKLPGRFHREICLFYFLGNIFLLIYYAVRM